MAFGEFDFARVSRSRNEVKADIINSVAKLANTLVSSQECPKKSRIRPSFCNADNNRIGFNHLYMLLNYILTGSFFNTFCAKKLKLKDKTQAKNSRKKLNLSEARPSNLRNSRK